MALQVFLHLTGVATWLGAGLVLLLLAPGAGPETMALLGRVQRVLVLPASLLTVFTGVTMSMGMISSHAEMSLSLLMMMGCGILGAALTVVGSRIAGKKALQMLTSISMLLVLVGIYCASARF